MSPRYAQLKKLDSKAIPRRVSEIRAFLCIKDEYLRLPYVLDYHRKLGIDRFFIIDNGSTDGTLDYLLKQNDCHVFNCSGKFFAENVEPPVWSNALRNVFGDGYWCLTLDADELFVYPRCEDVSLAEFCQYLDSTGSDALIALVIDMYSSRPILQSAYQRGQDLIEAFPLFDPEFGEQLHVDEGIPPLLTFSKFRQRAFRSDTQRNKRPPCITQIPLIRWRKGTNYLVAQHMIDRGKLSELQGAVLHFKFTPGFKDSIIQSIEENHGIQEKGLDERSAYVDALQENPDLCLNYPGAVRYCGSDQLTKLDWMKSSEQYENYFSKFI